MRALDLGENGPCNTEDEGAEVGEIGPSAPRSGRCQS
jgi:hypothetical protein